ncbi:MAG: hypothetical protein A4E52_00476 [Pelotomaculum sp. PtaB.Bin013]|nr:MAG: hypothetical protein A4E52_00476 [Pelotomaculum sp. PtaB.Bin013]
MNSKSIKFWLGGSLISLTGVVLARIVAPRFSEDMWLMIGVYILGITIALGGLVFVTFGMEKKTVGKKK